MICVGGICSWSHSLGSEVAQLVARNAVGLGRHDQKVAIQVTQPVHQLQIEFLRRNGDVNQRQAKHQRLAIFEIRIDELLPTARSLLWARVRSRSPEDRRRRSRDCGLPGRRTWKKLMVWVRPGVLLVLAILVPTRELIRLDLPTFERPRKAISGAPAGGNCRGSAAEVTKRVSTFMPSISPYRGGKCKWTLDGDQPAAVQRGPKEVGPWSHSTHSRGSGRFDFAPFASHRFRIASQK